MKNNVVAGLPIAARPQSSFQSEKPEATISDINAVKEVAKSVGGLKRLESMVNVVTALATKTGSLDKITQCIDFLNGGKKKEETPS